MKNYSMLKICVWVIYPIVFIAGISFMLINYIGDGMHEDDNLFVTDRIPPKETTAFTVAAIPDELKSHLLRADYLVSHYWDSFDFSDTAYINLPEITEQAFVDFLDVLPHADKLKAYFSISAMLERALTEEPAGIVYAYFIGLYRDYLYDPNSPMRDEEYYIPVAKHISENLANDIAAKERATFDLSMMLKNRKGHIATNFTYTLTNGNKDKLHNIKAEYTLLFFYYSDCMDCKRTKKMLENSQIINSLLRTGKLKILALYPGSDIKMWRTYSTTIPQHWINACDSSEDQIIKNKLYSIRAIPSLYLLDRDKRVVMKDVTAEQVFAFLNGETYK